MFFVFRKKVFLSVAAAVMICGVMFASVSERSIPTANPTSKVIVVDPGHGGMDSGGVGVNGLLEKDLNLQIAKKLAAKLGEKGYQVVMTRTEDIALYTGEPKTIRAQKNADLKKRAAIANEQNARVFISIHINKYPASSVRGAQVFYRNNDPSGKEYAQSIMKELWKIDGENHRQAKTIPNKNLTFSKLLVPGVLVECGFLSNEEEAANLQDEAYQMKLVDAIVSGVCEIS